MLPGAQYTPRESETRGEFSGRVGHRQRRRPGRGKRVLMGDPARFDGVAVVSVDEHVGPH